MLLLDVLIAKHKFHDIRMLPFSAWLSGLVLCCTEAFWIVTFLSRARTQLFSLTHRNNISWMKYSSVTVSNCRILKKLVDPQGLSRHRYVKWYGWHCLATFFYCPVNESVLNGRHWSSIWFVATLQHVTFCKRHGVSPTVYRIFSNMWGLIKWHLSYCLDVLPVSCRCSFVKLQWGTLPTPLT